MVLRREKRVTNVVCHALQVLERQDALAGECECGNNIRVYRLLNLCGCDIEERLPDTHSGIEDPDADVLVRPMFLDLGERSVKFTVCVCFNWESGRLLGGMRRR